MADSGIGYFVQERRAKQRTQVMKKALMFFDGQRDVFTCVVHNLTNEGAKIELNGPRVLPLDFNLSFDNFRTVRSCNVIWRENELVGIRFRPSCEAGVA
ncbi:MAG: PilZ domain-containing protein [Afipia sp.]|jgi:hypothetical protein|nr:PilZ domain-containing protein [Afipia sp.]